MRKAICTFLLLGIVAALGAAQGPADGTHFIVGSTYSYVHGSDSQGDFLIYRVTADGAKLWRKNLGGDEGDYLSTFTYAPTADNGVVVAGTSWSYSNGENDMLVYKLDASGNKEWRKNYGGELAEVPNGIIQTRDGGYLLMGQSDSYGAGDVDFLTYKLDASGNKQWRKGYGGASYDYGYAVAEMPDGGYVLAGYGASYVHMTGGIPFEKGSPSNDVLVYRIDAAGAKLWRKNLGGTGGDNGYGVAATGDGGCIVIGRTYSYTHGGYDILVYKLDETGAKQWRKNYGSADNERGWSVQQTADGGYVLAGYGDSGEGDYDMVVYKVDAAGTKQWRKYYGGENSDYAYVVYQTADGGYFIQGETHSYGLNGDLLAYRLAADGTKLWRKNYGGANQEWGWD